MRGGIDIMAGCSTYLVTVVLLVGCGTKQFEEHMNHSFGICASSTSSTCSLQLLSTLSNPISRISLIKVKMHVFQRMPHLKNKSKIYCLHIIFKFKFASLLRLR